MKNQNYNNELKQFLNTIRHNSYKERQKESVKFEQTIQVSAEKITDEIMVKLKTDFLNGVDYWYETDGRPYVIFSTKEIKNIEPNFIKETAYLVLDSLAHETRGRHNLFHFELSNHNFVMKKLSGQQTLQTNQETITEGSEPLVQIYLDLRKKQENTRLEHRNQIKNQLDQEFEVEYKKVFLALKRIAGAKKLMHHQTHKNFIPICLVSSRQIYRVTNTLENETQGKDNFFGLPTKEGSNEYFELALLR